MAKDRVELSHTQWQALEALYLHSMAHDYAEADLAVLQLHGLVEMNEFELGVTEKGANLLKDYRTAGRSGGIVITPDPARVEITSYPPAVDVRRTGPVGVAVRGLTGVLHEAPTPMDVPANATIVGSVAEAHDAGPSGTLDAVVIRWWQRVPAELPAPPPNAYEVLERIRDELGGLLEGRDHYVEDRFALQLAHSGVVTALQALNAGETGDESAMTNGLILARGFLERALVFLLGTVSGVYVEEFVRPAERLVAGLLGLQ